MILQEKKNKKNSWTKPYYGSFLHNTSSDLYTAEHFNFPHRKIYNNPYYISFFFDWVETRALNPSETNLQFFGDYGPG